MVDDRQRKILTAAKAVFLRHGFRRVTMGDIAAAAGVSRPALYLVFRNKEDVFRGVFAAWVDETITEIESALPAFPSPRDQLLAVFELWAVRPFEVVLQSPEARELVDCSLDFARDALEAGYARLEATLVPVIRPLLAGRTRRGFTAAKAARVLTASVRGFKQVATDADALRALIRDLLTLWLDGAGAS